MINKNGKGYRWGKEKLKNVSKMETVAHAWVLEHGHDCDGVSTRGDIIPLLDLKSAIQYSEYISEWSDGNYYTVTEKWSYVQEYAYNYGMPLDNALYVDEYAQTCARLRLEEAN